LDKKIQDVQLAMWNCRGCLGSFLYDDYKEQDIGDTSPTEPAPNDKTFRIIDELNLEKPAEDN
jgi:hypothetical protein